ncbi:UNVERIFIED_ORG: putative porin [Burkholderia sp. 1595]|uniref:Porin n=1 Tax=Paraburkholderia terricola TaxID=169427 RepID=A0ABU1LZZ7_9BURK|nr:porin [Paraburkholderia terricola]MDR6412332.1 putative porin [Paraburkholderia terricola]
MNNNDDGDIVTKTALLAIPLSVLASTAMAQSSVTLYGIIDNGITYATNQGGGHSVQAVSGVAAGSRWGFTGSEDLGGGMKAIFTLENGFDGFSGQAGPGGREFGRQAFVGLASNYGTLTLGRQYDLVVDYIQPLSSNGRWGGWYFSHPEDIDNTGSGFRVNNSVKYTSVNYSGITFAGMYSFGGVSGQFSQNSVWSVGAGYTNGALQVAAAYLNVKNPAVAVDGYSNTSSFTNVIYGNYLAQATSQRVAAIGGAYALGSLKALLNLSHTVFVSGDAGQEVAFNDVELGASYQFTPSLSLSGSYDFLDGKDHAIDQKPKYHQFNLMADYSLSKRTDTYLMAVYQRAAGDAPQAQITGFSAASGTEQFGLRAGLRHTF